MVKTVLISVYVRFWEPRRGESGPIVHGYHAATEALAFFLILVALNG